jgi:hypothetical protein
MRRPDWDAPTMVYVVIVDQAIEVVVADAREGDE